MIYLTRNYYNTLIKKSPKNPFVVFVISVSDRKVIDI